jgi:hypothetical protein
MVEPGILLGLLRYAGLSLYPLMGDPATYHVGATRAYMVRGTRPELAVVIYCEHISSRALQGPPAPPQSS